MKKIVLVLLAIVSAMWIQSCKKENQNDENTDSITKEDAQMVVATDIESDGLLDMVDLYAFESTSGNRNHALPSCVTQTVVTNGNNLTITWQFDPNGCTMPNGNTYSGTVIITRSRDVTARTVTGSLTFDNFYVNGIHIEGGSNFERQRSNANGNPEVTHQYDFTFTFVNGDVAERSGTRIREWIEGFNTPIHADDVFLIRGNAHFVFRNGNELDVEVINPLRREATCRYFVSGTVNITKNNQTAVLDYGNGTCDDEATLTLPNGTVHIIHL